MAGVEAVWMAVVAMAVVAMVNTGIHVGNDGVVDVGVRHKAAVAGVGRGHAGVEVGIGQGLGQGVGVGVSLTLLPAKVDEATTLDMVQGAGGEGDRVDMVGEGGDMVGEGGGVVDKRGGVVEEGGVVDEGVRHDLMGDLGRHLHHRLHDGVVGDSVGGGQDEGGVDNGLNTVG